MNVKTLLQIRQELSEKNGPISKRGMAKLLGISNNTYLRAEDRLSIKPFTKMKIASALKIPITEIDF